jgi:hypothetical protein
LSFNAHHAVLTDRAIADAFKDAAESFGVGAYLDDQEFVIRHLYTEGDTRWHKLKNQYLDSINAILLAVNCRFQLACYAAPEIKEF